MSLLSNISKLLRLVKVRKQFRTRPALHRLLVLACCTASLLLLYGAAGITGRVGDKGPGRTRPDFVEDGPEHRFWPEDANCGGLVTRFSRLHSLPTRWVRRGTAENVQITDV